MSSHMGKWVSCLAVGVLVLGGCGAVLTLPISVPEAWQDLPTDAAEHPLVGVEPAGIESLAELAGCWISFTVDDPNFVGVLFVDDEAGVIVEGHIHDPFETGTLFAYLNVDRANVLANGEVQLLDGGNIEGNVQGTQVSVDLWPYSGRAAVLSESRLIATVEGDAMVAHLCDVELDYCMGSTQYWYRVRDTFSCSDLTLELGDRTLRACEVGEGWIARLLE